MGDLVCADQSAFIKGWNVSDNFLPVHQIARNIGHREMKVALLKLDILCAFDSHSWHFLFEVLRSKGFTHRWRFWLTIVLPFASTRITVNGSPEETISHVRGVCKADPQLSVSLWLQWMFWNPWRSRQRKQGLWTQCRDVVLFIMPCLHHLTFARDALHMFGEPLDLKLIFTQTLEIFTRGT